MATEKQPQSGADILVQCLVNHGVEVVFAYPGGASMPIHQALTRFRTRLRTILPRHEQGAASWPRGTRAAPGDLLVQSPAADSYEPMDWAGACGIRYG